MFNKIGVIGDQLSVKRTVNCLSSLANGFTAEERLDGLHLEIPDWHAESKFLSGVNFHMYDISIAKAKHSILKLNLLVKYRIKKRAGVYCQV